MISRGYPAPSTAHGARSAAACDGVATTDATEMRRPASTTPPINGNAKGVVSDDGV